MCVAIHHINRIVSLLKLTYSSIWTISDQHYFPNTNLPIQTNKMSLLLKIY